MNDRVNAWMIVSAWMIELINNVPELALLTISTVFFILANGRKSIFGSHSESEVQGQY